MNKTDLCKIQPIFTAEELAKVYYETNLLEKHIVLETQGGYITIPKKWDNENEFDMYSRVCAFRSGDNKCILEDIDGMDLRPNFCKRVLDIDKKHPNKSIYEIVSDILHFNNPITKIKNISNKKDFIIVRQFNKEDLKKLKHDRLLYYILYVINRPEYNMTPIDIKVEYVYKLIGYKGSTPTINAIRELIYKTNTSVYKPICNIHNKLNRKFLYRDTDYIDLIRDKINRALKGLVFSNIPDEVFEDSVYNKEITKEIMKFIFAMYVINKTMARSTKIKYINGYIKNIDSLLVNYLIRYHLDAIFGEKEQLKEINEIKLNDILFKQDNSKIVDKYLDKDAEKLVKVFT